MRLAKRLFSAKFPTHYPEQISMPELKIIRVKLSDLFQLEGMPQFEKAPDVTEITHFVLKHYGFLPQPIMITIEGDEVVLQFPGESGAAQTEAARLAEKAAKRAAQGNYGKAIDIFKRVLELQPSLHSARRDLAMAYVETGDVENATNHLIEVLRLDPKDAWSWVVLANLYIREKSDLETGEKFLHKALELKPDDAWALNSLASVCHRRGKSDEAIALFERAIQSRPGFPNPYHGEAIIHASRGEPAKALETLRRLFYQAKEQDARSQQIYEAARELYLKLQTGLAKENHSEAFKCVQNYKAEMEALSGYPVRVEEGELEDKLGARIQMAWKHGRDYHLITTRRGYSPELLAHLQAHELTHLKMESEARKVGKNQFFGTTAKTRETAIRAVFPEMRKWQKEGHSDDAITKVTLSLISGLCGFLFNCPLDMLIERHLHKSFPVLRPAQFLSVRVMAMEAWETNNHPEVRRLTPRKILQASSALNGAYCLFLDELFQCASAFAAPYKKLDTIGLSQQLYQHWQAQSQDCVGGGENRLVDDFADMVGIRDWYEWKPDPGQHDVVAAPVWEGVTNPELLTQKHPAAVWHLLSALERYDKLPADKVREIAFEVAMLGQNGLDYSSPDKKYKLSTIPGETFSGLQMMCLMHAGFKRFAPEMETGIDLHEPFLTALELHQQGKEGN